MPGAYAHITLVNQLREPIQLESIPGFVGDAITSVLDHFKFCELGAVSPDYPYLGLGNRGATQWADRMHYEYTGDMIKSGVRCVVSMPNGEPRRKAFAWLLGYAAHVAADVTIHPIVELKVGPYTQNKTAHRICEMNQDAYIFQRLNLGEIGLAEHLDSGIWGCCDTPDSGNLDSAIADLWRTMLKECHPSPFRSCPPNLDAWHQGFRNIVDNVAEEGGSLFPFARHLAVNSGVTYPASGEIDQQYIQALNTPYHQHTMHYGEIFDRAIENVKIVWSLIARGISQADQAYTTGIGNWNLDTGRDDKNKLVFWG